MSEGSNIRTIETAHGRFSVDMLRDKKIGTNLQEGSYHQEDTLELLKNFITPDSVVVDIGAHIGTLAVPLAKLAGKVIAFEPAPSTFALLKKNIEQNNLTIDARNKGLGSRSGYASLQTEHFANAGANTLELGQGSIEVSTLDDEVEYADVIKIDVEGMELAVFEGGVELIEKVRPIIFSEVNLSALRAHGSLPQKIEQFLYKRGYDLYVPLGDKKLGKIGSLSLVSLLKAPRAYLLRSQSAPFDILAIPRGKSIPIPHISASATYWYLGADYFKKQTKRLRQFFFDKKNNSTLLVRKAVTFRASSIGDSLMGKYLLENIHAAFPEARCSILVAGKAGMIRDLLAAYPWIEIIEANKSQPLSIITAFRKLFLSDATVTQYSGRGQFATATKLFARAITRRGRFAGFTDAWPLNTYLYDRLIPFSMRRAMRLHECDALEALGIEVSIKDITLLAKEWNPVLERLHLEEKKYIILNLFSSTPARGLSLARQIDIARGLYDIFGKDKKIILTGGSFDAPIVEKIKEAVPEILDAPGLSMQELITLVAKSAGSVSLDTGVGHIGAQVGVPLVIMRTCWGYNWWNKDNYGREGIEVLSREDLCVNGHVSKNFPDCLDQIATSNIVAAAKELFI